MRCSDSRPYTVCDRVRPDTLPARLWITRIAAWPNSSKWSFLISFGGNAVKAWRLPEKALGTEKPRRPSWLHPGAPHPDGHPLRTPARGCLHVSGMEADMDRTDLFLHHANLELFRKQLANTTDNTKRRTLLELLDAEESKGPASNQLSVLKTAEALGRR